TSTPRTSRSACATTAPPEGPDRGMRGPPPATTAYPGGVNQFSPDAPARAHDFSLSSADDGLAALSAWRGYPRVQQPVWPDEAERSAAFDDLRAAPPLVFAGEVDVLRERVAAAARGAAVLLVAGDTPAPNAGQCAEPRYGDEETRGGVTLPTCRGDAGNYHAITLEARTSDPQLLWRMYTSGASTLTLLRACTGGGFAELREVHS